MSLTKEIKPSFAPEESVYYGNTSVKVVRLETMYEHRYLVERADGTRVWLDQEDLARYRR